MRTQKTSLGSWLSMKNAKYGRTLECQPVSHNVLSVGEQWDSQNKGPFSMRNLCESSWNRALGQYHHVGWHGLEHSIRHSDSLSNSASCLCTVLTGDSSNMRTVTGFEIFTAMTNTTFWGVTSCSSVETSGSASRLLIAVCCEAIHSFELLVDIYRIALSYNSENRILYGNGCSKNSKGFWLQHFFQNNDFTS